MDAHELPLEDLISPARYQRYRAAARGDTARAARLYMWNCDLSAAYWPSIALVEVAIRNTIDIQLCSHLGVTREDGWHADVLADRPRIHLTDKERDKVKKSLDAFDLRNNPAGQPRVEPTGGDIVADLSLGFWVSLVGEGIPRRHANVYDYFTKLWRPFLYKAFPHYGPGMTSAGPLRNDLRTFELLRNRIAHHEHIFTLNHPHNLNTIINIAGYINPPLADYIRSSQQVTAVTTRYGSYVLQQPAGE
ncbi:Abi-like protein [Mycobacterium marinum]|uniref:Abi family protein n=1 Tax=Mycobacterium marinum TaxID=1781 RepID=UPI00045FD20D|nr:Abi family protein [Mycobacterium marinum]RFZ50604.1 Abi-like protein [Mycobacterium marinum]CDM77193.1 Abi-like protein [Mycobacterium marinum E11]